MTDLGDAQLEARLSRRNALKAAAAAGVGVMALAGPQVGVLGTAPAYAVGCSKSDSGTAVGSVNCGGSNCASGEVRLNQSNAPTVLQVGDVTITLASLNNQCTNSALPITYSNGTGAGVSCSAVISVVGGPQNLLLPAIVPKKDPNGPGNAGYCNANWTLTFTCVGTDC